MPKHRVKQNGIFYIIPNDELYQRYRNGEAFVDKYGRLINSQTKRVIKELEQVADERPVVVIQPREERSIKNAIKEGAAEGLKEVAYRGIDYLFHDLFPYLWHEKIMPSLQDYKEYKRNGRKLKAELIIDEAKTSLADTQPSTKPKTTKTVMTEEEILDVQRKALLHYIGLLESLTKLHNAGVIDRDSTLEQLTNPAAIEQFNQTISGNPNLLEMTQHIKLNSLLGRDLFQSGIFVPLEAKEIEVLATNSKQEE